MNAELLAFLRELAKHPSDTIPAPESHPELHGYCMQLFDLGYLNVAPPGWRFRINAEGRALLATVPAQAAA